MLDSWVDNGMPELAEYVYQTWIESGEWRWFEGRLRNQDNYGKFYILQAHHPSLRITMGWSLRTNTSNMCTHLGISSNLKNS
jgi:hypothetical protein